MGQEFYNKILQNNRDWVESKLSNDPEFFKRLEEGQTPPLLWIGCADSRVPANEIIGTNPGEVFVHRNISNMVVHTDMNMLSVLEYAVSILKVEHIIVCGHYGCGGVKAAMGNQSFGIIDNWLRHLKDVYRIYQDELDGLKDEQKRWDRFVELNVIEQVYDLAETSIVQKVWKNNQKLTLHGWAYGIGSGLVNDLKVDVRSTKDLEDVFKLKF